MKNKALQLVLFAIWAAMLALTGCSDEEFTREAGTTPDGEALTGIRAELRRADQIDDAVRLLDADVDDYLCCRLSSPARKEMTLTLALDEKAVETYNDANGTDYVLFPKENITLLYQSSIAPGQESSNNVRVTFKREGVAEGTYLLPVKAAIDDPSVRQQDEDMTVVYQVRVFEDTPRTELDQWPFITVGYINTEQMNPLYANGFFYATEVNMGPPMTRTNKTWLDLVPLRRADIVKNPSMGRVSLELGPDLAYVFNNREKYIVPLQRSGRKVFICINGCLRSLDDHQIAEVAYRIGAVVARYEIDGVNFFDLGDSYADAADINPASYAKLIKATKEILGSKLVTIACDAASTDELSVAQEGVEAGRYLDYAWSGIFDEAVDAYEEGAILKAIKGLDRSKYGGAMLQAHTTSWDAQNGNALKNAMTDLYKNHSESANVFAFWDMPTNQQGIEGGPGKAFTVILQAVSDMAAKKMYMLGSVNWGGNYGAFVKDW